MTVTMRGVNELLTCGILQPSSRVSNNKKRSRCPSWHPSVFSVWLTVIAACTPGTSRLLLFVRMVLVIIAELHVARNAPSLCFLLSIHPGHHQARSSTILDRRKFIRVGTNNQYVTSSAFVWLVCRHRSTSDGLSFPTLAVLLVSPLLAGTVDLSVSPFVQSTCFYF